MSNVCKFLTIVVPTYNRKERLIRQLSSIQKIGCIDWYYLVILDNHSNYDISQELSSVFSADFVDNIIVVKRKFNTGAGYNIAGAFEYAKTKWLWIISDDDVTPPDALKIIQNYTEKYPDAAIIEFSIGLDGKFDDRLIRSIQDLKKAYDDNLFVSGDLMYIGNNLYNCEVQMPYFGESCFYNYTMVPQIISSMKILLEQKGLYVLSSAHVQTFVPNVHGDTWHSIKIVLAICSVYDIRWGTYAECNIFADILMRHFSVNELLYVYLSEEKDLQYRKYVYRRFLNTVFTREMPYKERVKIRLYGIQMNSGIPVLSIGARIYRLWKFLDNFVYRIHEFLARLKRFLLNNVRKS